MRRRNLILALPLAALAGSALANEPAPATTTSGQYVDLAPVALPIVVDGRLINYIFVYVRINLTGRADAPKLRDKEPYFRDALVRMAHRTPFTRFDDYTSADEGRLKAAMLAASNVIAGPGAVKSIQILSATPRRRTGLPTPKIAVRRWP